MRNDLYAILGISADSDEKEIRAAYRRLAKKYHPDTGEGSSAEKFRAVQNAYDTLGDPDRRRTYDREVRDSGLRDTVANARRPTVSAAGAYRRASHIDLTDFGRRPQRPEPIDPRFQSGRHSEADQFWAEVSDLLDSLSRR
jgi:curved DNA-binding protein CbpA